MTNKMDIEKNVQVEQQILKTITNSVLDAIILMDDKGEIGFWNPASERIFGYNSSEVMGKNVHELLAPPEYHAAYRSAFKDFAVSGRGNAIGKTTELVARRKDGEEFPIALSLSSFQMDGHWHAAGIVRDITERKKMEETLRLSEAEKNAILNGITTNIAFVNDKLQILWLNNAAAESVGRSPEEIIGTTCHSLWANPARPCENCPTVKAFQTKKSEKTIMTTPDGRIWEERGEPVIDDRGNLTGVVEVAQDITQRKRAEDELRESEERFRLLFEKSPLGIIRFDSNGVVTDCNQVFLEIIGSSREKTIGFNLLTSLRNEGVRKAVQSALSGTTGQFEGEYTSITGGKTAWLNLLYAPVSGTEGLITGGLGIFEDITERKRAEETLKETTIFLNTLIDAIPVPLFYKDTDGRYLGFNKSYEEFYGKTKQELVGKSVFDIAPVDLAEVYHAKDLELFHNPGAQVYDSQLKDASGAVHDVVFHKSTFLNLEGHVIGLIGAILDITERKRLEEDKESVIIELQKALSEVKQLKLFLPICSSCKKIRDDQGYWNEIERYIGEHTDTQFSHGICPDCMRKLYPEYADAVLSRLEKDEKK